MQKKNTYVYGKLFFIYFNYLNFNRKNFSGQTSTTNKNGFSAKVIEIGLIDSIVVLKENGEELKIYLSSLRPPR
jgi:hypothetical protein